MDWPSDDALESETLGGNRDFSPLGRMGWLEVGITLDEEREILEEISGSKDPEATYREFEDNEDSDEPALYGFDLGTNALAAALSAASCIPFYSCNGGAFDDGHHETYPLVAFFCPTGIFPFILAAAEKAAVGLEYSHAGRLSIFARKVDGLIGTAAALYERRTEIDSIEGVPRVATD